MTIAVRTAPTTEHFTAAAAAQKLLPELVALALHAKQAHWNVTGPGFLPLHTLTDQLSVDAHAWADRVAERAVALGFAVDARPPTVAAATGPFPAGHVRDREVTSELITILDTVATTGRESVDALEDTDPVTEGLILDVLGGLDGYRWMFRAQQR
jgi:starvation-inducible DNA-binding protein